MIVANPGDADAKTRAENAIARLEEKAESLGSNTQLIEALRTLCDAGLDRARVFLGILLRPTDPKESVKLFTAAAERGDRRAMLILGLQLAKGDGVNKADDNAAAMWLKRASDLGDPEAMLGYGECLEEGQGVPQDFNAAAQLYSKAAALGVVAAKSKLGVLYRRGQGVPKVDYNEALRLFKEAAADGFVEAQGNLGVMYILGEGVPADPTKAVELWKDGAEKGDSNCMFSLALALEGGDAGPPDLEAAKYWYRQAALKGHVRAIERSLELGIEL
jgi:TPR repeat protein